MDEDGDKIDDVRVEEASVPSVASEVDQVVERKEAREEVKEESAEEQKEKVQEELSMQGEMRERIEEEVQCAQEDVKVQESGEEAQEEVKVREEAEVREITEVQVQEDLKAQESAKPEVKALEEVKAQESVEAKAQEEAKTFDCAEVMARKSADIKGTIVGMNQSVDNQNPTPASKRTSITRSVLARTPIAKKLEPQRTQRATPSKDTRGYLRLVTPVKAKIASPVLRNTTNTTRTARIGEALKVPRPALGTSTTRATCPRNAVAQTSSLVRSPVTKRTPAVPAKGANSQQKNSSFRTHTASAPVTPPKAAVTSSLRTSKAMVAARPTPSKSAPAKKMAMPAPVTKSSAPMRLVAAARVLKTVASSNSIKTRLSTASESLVKTMPKVPTKNIMA